jgi:hypothetical protein
MLGDLVPRYQEEKPLHALVGLGRLMAAVHQAALVVCVDQFEHMIQLSALEEKEKRGEMFCQAVEVLVAITEQVQTAVIVVSCLEDYYTAVAGALTKSLLDRLARDSEPIRLTSQRSVEEIRAMIARRLEVLYAEAGAVPDPANSTYPFTEAHLQKLSGLRTRDVLDYCRRHHDACMLAQCWLKPEWQPSDKPDGGAGVRDGKEPRLELEQRWNDYRASMKPPALEDEAELAALLGSALEAVSAEMPEGLHFSAEPNGRMIQLEAQGPGNVIDKLLVVRQSSIDG